MFGSKDPGRKGKPQTWSVNTLKEGGQFSAWIAGPMIGVYVHHLSASKPCYWEMTGEQLECPYCRLRGIPQWKGYLPLYDESGKPVVVLVHENHKPQVDCLRLHDPVIVRRDKPKYQTIVVKLDKTGSYYRPGKSDRHAAADIRPWLLFTLWKEPALVEHFNSLKAFPPLPTMERAGPAKVETAPAAPKFDLKREVLGEVLRQNGHHATAKNLPPSIDDSLDEVQRRLKEKVSRAERNGKGG